MKTGTLILIAAFVAAIGAVFLITVPDWMRPPHSQEMGYRGLNMIQFTEPGTKNPLDALPAPIPASVEIPAGGFKNVQVLKGESPQQFMRLQYALTEWVSPQQGCGFCHTGNDFASDANPHKLVARRMLQMTQYINSDWKSHVGQVGVTCYTCHRGQPMPPKAWFLDTPLPRTGILGAPSVFKETAHTVRDFFPNAGWEEYYLQNNPIHVESRTVTPTGDTSTASEAARVYEMMMQMSDGMGGELHLLPQLHQLLRLGLVPAAALDRALRLPHDGSAKPALRLAAAQRHAPGAARPQPGQFADPPAARTRRAGRQRAGQLRHLPRGCAQAAAGG